MTRPAAASASMRLRFASRQRASSAPRYESVTSAELCSASWIAASSAASPPPTTSTFAPSYCSGSVSPYATFASSSPGTPSLRGVPRRPMASTTFAAGTGPRSVSTTKRPSSPVRPVTFTPCSTQDGGALEDALEVREQLLLRDEPLAEAAHERELHRLGHRDLLARVVRDGAAHVTLLEEPERDAPRLETERRGDPGGARADDHDVARASRHDLGEPLGHLEPLHDRVPDEPHPSQLADDVHPWPRGLEERVDLGEIDAALCGAEDEPDGAHRALGGAPAVTDAVVAVDQPRRAVHDAQDVALGAGAQAGEAADADVRVDHRVKRAREVPAARGAELGLVAALPNDPARHVATRE